MGILRDSVGTDKGLAEIFLRSTSQKIRFVNQAMKYAVVHSLLLLWYSGSSLLPTQVKSLMIASIMTFAKC